MDAADGAAGEGVGGGAGGVAGEGGISPAVRVRWAWGEVPMLIVTSSAEGIDLVVDPRLSEREVGRACRELSAWGWQVERAWRVAAGLEQPEGVRLEQH